MRGPRPCRRRISTRSSRSTTSGIATTTTATATSTSPTATSTISSRSTRASARRPAAAHRAPTRSGRIAGTPTTLDPRSGLTAPGRNGYQGIRIGNSNYWIGDYTIEPENGGVGVFSHEFAHDLGLPDEYDTSGNTGGAENGTGFWTLMSQGSYGNNGVAAEGIGDRPFHMNAWDKLQLGWLDYTALRPGDKKASLKLGPAEATTKQDQAVIVVLPDKQVTFDLGRAVRRLEVLLLGHGQRLHDVDDEVGDAPGGGDPLGEGSIQRRAGLRLRVPDGGRNPRRRRTSATGITGATPSTNWVDADRQPSERPAHDRVPLRDRRCRRRGTPGRPTCLGSRSTRSRSPA